jgi:2-methylcitrate dehydratase PrpD
MSTISERLAEFILDTKFESLPDDLIARMQACTLDLIGVTLVGTG